MDVAHDRESGTHNPSTLEGATTHGLGTTDAVGCSGRGNTTDSASSHSDQHNDRTQPSRRTTDPSELTPQNPVTVSPPETAHPEPPRLTPRRSAEADNRPATNHPDRRRVTTHFHRCHKVADGTNSILGRRTLDIDVWSHDAYLTAGAGPAAAVVAAGELRRRHPEQVAEAVYVHQPKYSNPPPPSRLSWDR